MALTLRVADVVTRVVCDEPGVALGVPGPGRRFLVAGGEPDVTIRVERAPRLIQPDRATLFDSGVVWRLYRDSDEFIFSFGSATSGPAPNRLARFDASFTRGTIWLNRACLRDDAALEPLEYPLDELLMINLLARGRGVEVHACGVIDQGGTAYLFAGQSGAGKSTIARLWQDEKATILSDDRVVLRVRDRRVWVYGTPWHGEAAFASPASAPLARLFFLEHGPENRVTPIGASAATARLFACSFPPFYDEAGLDFTLGFLANVVDAVPCSELIFTPDARVVDFVRAAV